MLSEPSSELHSTGDLKEAVNENEIEFEVNFTDVAVQTIQIKPPVPVVIEVPKEEPSKIEPGKNYPSSYTPSSQFIKTPQGMYFLYCNHIIAKPQDTIKLSVKKKQRNKTQKSNTSNRSSSKSKTEAKVEKESQAIAPKSVIESDSSSSESEAEDAKPTPMKSVKVEPKNQRMFKAFGTYEENKENLLNERVKIDRCLRQMNFFVHKTSQTDAISIGEFEPKVEVKSTNMTNKSTQKPTEDDIIDEIVETVEPITVAQTQLNILVSTLEKLKSEGMLSHINITEEGKISESISYRYGTDQD